MLRARSEASKENRKQFILDCAERLILEEGLPNLSIGKVSKKSKLAVGTIYLYFNSKEDIIANLTIKSREILLQKFVEHANKKEDALEKIAEILIAFYSFYKEKPFYNQLVSFYETNSGLQETQELKAASHKITDFVIGIIQQGKAQKSIRSDIHAAAFALWLWGATVGVIQFIDVKSTALSETLQSDQFDFFNIHIAQVVNALKR